jgi:GNAT superfamily N-acetyltransferase
MPSNDIVIRPFQPSDAGAVVAIIQANLVQVNSLDTDPTIISDMFFKYTVAEVLRLGKSRQMFVAYKNDVILGTVSLEQDTVYTLFVNPAAHSHGVGSALMDFIENLALKTGQAQLKVPSSLYAHNFYLKRRYTDVRDVYEHGQKASIVMRKDL